MQTTASDACISCVHGINCVSPDSTCFEYTQNHAKQSIKCELHGLQWPQRQARESLSSPCHLIGCMVARPQEAREHRQSALASPGLCCARCQPLAASCLSLQRPPNGLLAASLPYPASVARNEMLRAAAWGRSLSESYSSWQVLPVVCWWAEWRRRVFWSETPPPVPLPLERRAASRLAAADEVG